MAKQSSNQGEPSDTPRMQSQSIFGLQTPSRHQTGTGFP